MNFDHEIFNDLTLLEWNSFEECLLSPGDIFFVSRKGAKPVRLLKVGDLIDNKFLGKYQLFRDRIYVRQVIDESKLLFKEFIGHDLKLRRKERLLRKESFIKSFFNDVWLKTDQDNFESFVYTCFNTFSSFERSILFEIEDSNQLLFRRATVIGAMGVFLAHCVDCNDYRFMKELYNSLFCLDVGLIYPKANFHLLHALKIDRESSGAGIAYLKERKVDQEIIDQYLNHSFKSIEVIEKTWDLTFSDDKIYNIIKLHHEAPNGSGFPNKISSKQVFHWEEIAYFLDQWIPFDKDCFDLEKIQNDFYKQDGKSTCYQYMIKWQEIIEEGLTG